jgi:hypothetical protein
MLITILHPFFKRILGADLTEMCHRAAKDAIRESINYQSFLVYVHIN